MTLDELIRTARERGLREMRINLIGTQDPQWQISSRFVKSSGYHISIGPDLGETMLKALTPPTGAEPLAKPAVGLFD